MGKLPLVFSGTRAGTSHNRFESQQKIDHREALAIYANLNYAPARCWLREGNDAAQ